MVSSKFCRHPKELVSWYYKILNNNTSLLFLPMCDDVIKLPQSVTASDVVFQHSGFSGG